MADKKLGEYLLELIEQGTFDEFLADPDVSLQSGLSAESIALLRNDPPPTLDEVRAKILEEYGGDDAIVVGWVVGNWAVVLNVTDGSSDVSSA
jgi:hypothetical protein